MQFRQAPLTLLTERPGAFPDVSRPAFQASSMIVCRDDGVKAPDPLRPGRPAKVPNEPTASSWWQRFPALPVVDRTAFHCPAGDHGSAVPAGFLGAKATAVVVQVALQGRQYVTIRQDTYQAQGSTLRDDLLRLVP
ncbi:hypothetical protein [Actinoplanes subtropicus]|uniref:hypothetical protein n=1 Tax=Actinoplanes subtropicus TaxID=543632 RepID=UPI0012F93B08|nr:hypothetical protein [Actinoplanes subtropicus]